MKSIDTVSISFQAPVRQAKNSFQSKNVVQQTNEESAFSKVFHSTSSDQEKVNRDELEEVLKATEEALNVLQEQPKDSLSAEEMGMLSSVLQLLSQKISDLLVQQLENQSSETNTQQLESERNALIAFSTKEFAEPLPFMGVDEKNFLNKFNRDFEQAINLVKTQLERVQQTVPFKQGESIVTLFQRLTFLMEDMAQGIEQEQMTGQPLKIEFSLPLGEAHGQLQRGNSLLTLEQNPDQPNSQGITVSAVQGAQGSQVAQRVESSPQSSFVRFSHFIEDLSEIFGGTYRLHSTLEGTQLRVNIFPEHLGHLDIRLTSIDGKITAQIFTASLTAKEALDLQVQQLRNSLIQQGVPVEKIEIAHQPSQQSFGQQHAHPEQRFSQQQHRQGISPRNGNAYLLTEEEAATDRQPFADGSVQVNYTI
ncbi:flagellar hook-length control protein FliK [Mesobacillus maritimus]|uniref:flagellar hook-length control protein FliK n=1 Tax=Mesobacillus maritimus TaxID=1643336 RepID=UPI00384ED385